MTHICISKLTIIGSDNDLSPGRRQVIIWTNAGLLSIGTLRTNFSEILSEIYTFSLKENAFKNVVCKIAAPLLWPQCVNNVEVSKSYLPKDVWTALPCFRLYLGLRLKAFITYIHVRRNWWNSMNWWSGHIAVCSTNSRVAGELKCHGAQVSAL